MTDAASCADAPPVDLERAVAAELGPLRARLLRRAGIAHRGPVLDLGAGHGVVTQELQRRARGPVLALDRRERPAGVELPWVRAEASALPFATGELELVYAQHVFMWVADLDPVLAEVARVLAPGGLLAALEPDFCGMIEQPPDIAVAEIWRAALTRAGARIDAGSALASALGRAGWRVEIHLATSVTPADPDRYDRLEGLPLTNDERARLSAAARADRDLPPAARVVHLPYVGVLAEPVLSSSRPVCAPRP